MRFRNPLVLAVTTVAILGATALPASAADTSTTFELTGGSLSVTALPTKGLTNQASGVDAKTITGTLGTVSVNDARGDIIGWTVTAASTAFAAPGVTATSSAATYTRGELLSKTGTSTVTAGPGGLIQGAPKTISTATLVSGNNTASWDPTLDVSMPAGALKGVYTGVVTTSIA